MTLKEKCFERQKNNIGARKVHSGGAILMVVFAFSPSKSCFLKKLNSALFCGSTPMKRQMDQN